MKSVFTQITPDFNFFLSNSWNLCLTGKALMLDMVNRYDRVEVMRSFRLKRIKRPKAVKVKQGVKHDSDIVKSIYKIF